MSRLRIERTSPTSPHCELRIAGEESEGYDDLLPDETLSSWSQRHQFVRLTSNDREERDFGTLQVDLPGAQQSLLRELCHAATAPDAWLLRRHQRTLHCVKCLAEDKVLGLPPFERRAWAVAWRTCCPRHGMLFDSGKKKMPSWESCLSAPGWSGDEIAIVLNRPFGVVLAFNLHGDHRAIHLETALADADQGAVWFPQGLDASSLREAYQRIVTDLIEQFYMQRSAAPTDLPNGEFNGQLNPNRFAVNAMAEAILSEWTNTPLPECARAQNTSLLVRAIGWGQGRPTILRRGQVLFRGPVERRCELTHYGTLLGLSQYQNLSNPTACEHWGYFTLPEARRLNLDTAVALQWLVDLTHRGQFLAFDAKGGCLTENPALPERSRLRQEDAESYKLLMPSWAFGPPTPPAVWNQEDYVLFGPRSPEWVLRWKAIRRRSEKQSRRNVRFQGLCPHCLADK